VTDTTPVLAEKRCSKCDQTKPLSEFHKDPRTRDGLRTWCKDCAIEKVRESQARRRQAMGDEQWLAHQAELRRQSRSKPGGRDRDRVSNRAYSAALFQLRDLHRAQFDALLERERYERGLT
jgi:hypothetical protein